MADGELHKFFKDHLVGVHWQRIETGSTGRGIPDLNGCLAGCELWIENKKADHWAVEIMPEQVGWIERRARAGGRVFIAVRRARTELWLLPPSAARVLATPRKGLRDLSQEQVLGRWAGGPKAWDWRAVRGHLFPVIPCAQPSRTSGSSP